MSSRCSKRFRSGWSAPRCAETLNRSGWRVQTLPSSLKLGAQYGLCELSSRTTIALESKDVKLTKVARRLCCSRLPVGRLLGVLKQLLCCTFLKPQLWPLDCLLNA